MEGYIRCGRNWNGSAHISQEIRVLASIRKNKTEFDSIVQESTIRDELYKKINRSRLNLNQRESISKEGNVREMATLHLFRRTRNAGDRQRSITEFQASGCTRISSYLESRRLVQKVQWFLRAWERPSLPTWTPVSGSLARDDKEKTGNLRSPGHRKMQPRLSLPQFLSFHTVLC